MLAWLSPIDAVATRQVEDGLTRSLESFAVARSLNAVISLLQSTDASFAVFGIGGKVSPFQVLEPIHSLIAQFGDLMLAASIAFGVQRLLIAIGAHWVLSTLLTLASAAWCWQAWRGRASPGWLNQTLFILLLVKFSVPAVTLASDQVFQAVMEKPYVEAQAAITGSSERLSELSPPPVEPGTAESMNERAKRWWSGASQKLDVSARIAAWRDVASQTVKHFIQVMVVFLLQTLILPLLFLWAFLKVGRSLLFDTKRQLVF
jgi:hypothetical protein